MTWALIRALVSAGGPLVGEVYAIDAGLEGELDVLERSRTTAAANT